LVLSNTVIILQKENLFAVISDFLTASFCLNDTAKGSCETIISPAVGKSKMQLISAFIARTDIHIMSHSAMVKSDRR
jgi:hypothetical protein